MSLGIFIGCGVTGNPLAVRVVEALLKSMSWLSCTWEFMVISCIGCICGVGGAKVRGGLDSMLTELTGTLLYP